MVNLVFLVFCIIPHFLLAQADTTSKIWTSADMRSEGMLPYYPATHCDSLPIGSKAKRDCADAALLEFVFDRLPGASSADFSGRVWISFVVEMDGSLSLFEVKAPRADAAWEQALLKVLETLPKGWAPAQVKGEKVRFRFKLTPCIHFR